MSFPNPAARAWLARATGIGPGDLALEPLPGATSATVYRVSDASGQTGDRFVLRLFTLASWLAEEPDLARHEAAALDEAGRTGLPVPELVAYLPGPSATDSADPAGFGVPAVLMTLLPGRVELQPADRSAWLRELARTLAVVHEYPADGFAWRYRSWALPENVGVPAWAADRALWEAAAAAHSAWLPVGGAGGPGAEPGATFLHRDYHALNLLFLGSGAGVRVSGVVDWVNACVGPAAADVSHCRIDLLAMHGPAAAAEFLAHYRDVRAGFDYDPRWDLEAVFDVATSAAGVHGPWAAFGIEPPAQAAARARVEEHVRRALAELA